jgi:hypothetical protein
LFYRPDLTQVDLAPEYEREKRNCPAGALADRVASAAAR